MKKLDRYCFKWFRLAWTYLVGHTYLEGKRISVRKYYRLKRQGKIVLTDFPVKGIYWGLVGLLTSLHFLG